MSSITDEFRRRRRKHRRPSRPPQIDRLLPHESGSIDIRIGNRKAQNFYHGIRVSSPREATLFKRLIDNTVSQNPRDPLVIAVNGYRPWLEEIFSACIDDHYSDPGMTNREVQYSDTVQFPQKSDKRTKWVPWTFIVDQMNVPEVYYWTFGITPPNDRRLQDIDNYRFRMGAWLCGRGAYRGDDRVPVVIIFTQPTEVSELLVTEMLFSHLCHDLDWDPPKMDEEGLAWLFLHLYNLLTDWQNIIRELERRLDEAELNSRGRNIPVKLRTRSMHKEIDRLYELTEYLRFHSRSFKKLSKLKTSVPQNEQEDPIWDQTDDIIDDLEQYDYYLNSLKERFNNLIELEFNISNATQSDNSRFLSVIGALYLPVSYLASVFGITSINWSVLLYVYIAIPLFVVSCLFVVATPFVVQWWQRRLYPLQKEHVVLGRADFSLLGQSLPDSADAPNSRATPVVGKDAGFAEKGPRGRTQSVGGQKKRRRRRAASGTVSETSEITPDLSERARSRRRGG